MVLKTDVLGPVKTPAERREQLLDEFERSGLNGQKCAGAGGSKIPDVRQMGAEAQTSARSILELLTRRIAKAESVRWLEAVVQEAKATGDRQAEAMVPGLLSRLSINTPDNATILCREPQKEIAGSSYLPLAFTHRIQGPQGWPNAQNSEVVVVLPQSATRAIVDKQPAFKFKWGVQAPMDGDFAPGLFFRRPQRVWLKSGAGLLPFTQHPPNNA